MATTTGSMTVEQFRQLPETGPFYYELRHGEPVPVTRPKFKHHLLQSRLRDLLKSVAPAGACVEYELAFRPLPEFELRVADVAYLSAERFQQTDPDDNTRGAPDLVIEVLSPSITVAEMNEKEKLCLENGAREFWVVDLTLRQVKVSTPDGVTTTYRAGQEIPLRVLRAGALKVDEIFA